MTTTERIQKEAQSILRHDPCDLSQSEWRNLKRSANRLIDRMESLEAEDWNDNLREIWRDLLELSR